MNRLIKWWFSPRFPVTQYKRIIAYKPDGVFLFLNYLSKNWIIHPIKRRIAKYYLIFLKNFFGLKVIAITGSVGKTTTKEMVAAILKKVAPTVNSFANIDPVYNIPTTILRCRPSTKYLVLEMGVEYPGEMDFYLWLANPDISVLTNIFNTHTLYFKNIEGVIKEKVKLIEAVDKNGYVVLNSKNSIPQKVYRKVKGNPIYFGDQNDFASEKVTYTRNLKTKLILRVKKNKTNVILPILGKQFVENALAAAAVAATLGASIEKIKGGLERFQVPPHRMAVKKLKSGSLIIDDAYNNNPYAAVESLNAFDEIAKGKRKIIVFGDMLELGNLEGRAHRQIGQYILRLKPDYLICVGALSKYVFEATKTKLGDKTKWAQNKEEALKILRKIIYRKSIVLVKGSRSLGLEKIVSRLS